MYVAHRGCEENTIKNDSYLNDLEDRSIYIIREAYREYRGRTALLWSMGKDSTTLLHLARKAFFGKVPLPVVHIDTGYKFKDIYSFRAKISRAWRLDLVVARNEPALAEGMSPGKGRFKCCSALKTRALQEAVSLHGYKALLVAIRRDEHSIRAKERYFSPRGRDFRWDYRGRALELWAEYHDDGCSSSAGAHARIHPMLHWRERDIWEYVKRERLPVVPLYFSSGGRRYRSIGCECCCSPVPSGAGSINGIIEELSSTDVEERSGRANDKENEYTMQKLRSLGYM